MSGEIIEVLGTGAWFPGGGCPADLKAKTFVLKSADGQAFKVEAEELCLARNAVKIAQTRGDDAEIELPLQKSTVAKLVEYLKYHKDVPPGEIRVPLESDNLVECGALKWDVAFINLEKDLIFQLLLAAIIMDIPSLTFLAVAKASLMIKGKAPKQLVKDFKMADDLPEEEEEALSSIFTAQKEKINAIPDRSGVGGVAIIMTAVIQAAEKNGILSSTRGAQPGPSAVSLLSFRLAIWRAIVLSDWTQLSTAPEEVCADRDLIFTAIGLSSGAALQFAPDDLRADRTLILEAVKYKGECLAKAAPALRSDRSFVMEAIAINGAALAGASSDLREDRDLVFTAARQGRGSALQGAADALRKDREFVLELIKQDPEAFKHAAAELVHAQPFAIEAATANGAVLRYMPFHFRADQSIVKAALANDASAFAFAHTATRAALNVAAPWDTEPSNVAAVKKQESMGMGASAEFPVGARMVGVPLTKEDATAAGITSYHMKLNKSVQFSALSTMSANMGQANYIAANSFLDKLPFFERPAMDSVTLMWGAVGNIGMRWKAFASADMLNANPEALMSVSDAAKVLKVTAARIDPPEWYAASFFDEWTRQSMLAQTAGTQSGGGFRPGEDYRSPEPVEKAMGAHPLTLDVERAEEEKPKLGGSNSPLGGWPNLGSWHEPQAAPQGAGAAPQPAQHEFAEGARIKLSGLQAKSGLAGTLLKRCADCKWRVQMDGDGGIALLNECYMVVISPSTVQIDDVKKAAAARRLQAIQDRKVRMQAKAEEAAQSRV